MSKTGFHCLTSIVAALLFLVAVAPVAGAQREDDSLIDDPMNADPSIAVPRLEKTFHPRLLELWLAALARPESDLRRNAATAMAMAHERGMPDVVKTVGMQLTAVVRNSKENSLVRQAAADALVRMDARDYAEALDAANAESHEDLVLLTDPALARWGHAPAAERWQKRLTDPQTPWPVRRSAAESLGIAGVASAVKPLLAVAEDAAAGEVLRLTAASAVGRIAKAGLAGRARSLATGGGVQRVDQLVAIAMLRSHAKDAAAHGVLASLAESSDPAIAAAALEALLPLAPKVVEDRLATLVRHPDSRVRLMAVRLAQAIAAPKTVPVLATAMGDHLSSIRFEARNAMIALGGKKPLQAAVDRAVGELLASGTPTATEQAALAAGKLGMRNHVQRMVEVMAASPAYATRVAAVAAVRWLDADAGKATARDRIAALTSTKPSAHEVSTELAQLFQLVGVAVDTEIEPLVIPLIPKKAPFGSSARSAAIWALGKAFDGQKKPQIVSQLQARLADWQGLEPESDDVRQMAAITMGRLGDNRTVNVLRKFAEMGESSDLIKGACFWSISRLTGTPLSDPEPVKLPETGWFLEPLD